MPKRIYATDTFEVIENEVMFTRSALKADEDARPFLSETEDWFARIERGRTADRAFREKDMDATAARSIANVRLDIACLAFGKDLLYAAGDRASRRFTSFFPVAPWRFVKQPFGDQLLKVKGWIGVTGEAVLDQHREQLTLRVQNADAAQVAVAALGPARGANWDARTQLADDLTRLRDGLHRALADHAAEKGLPREWPDAFFRVERDSAAPPTGGGGDGGGGEGGGGTPS